MTASPQTMFGLDALLGDELLSKAKGPAKSTLELMEGKELVGLYFSASWCPPCKTFSPILADFYKAIATRGRLEIVYVSSDKTVEEFEGYYKNMPWLAIPFVKGSAAIKSRLSQTLQIRGIPMLIIIDAKTGECVSGTAREEVTAAGGDAAKAKALVDSWKLADRKPLSEANQSGDRPFLIKFIMFFAKNPMYLFGLLYIYKQVSDKMREWYPDTAPTLEEDAVGGPDNTEF